MMISGFSLETMFRIVVMDIHMLCTKLFAVEIGPDLMYTTVSYMERYILSAGHVVHVHHY